MPMWTVTFIAAGKRSDGKAMVGEDSRHWQNEDLAKEFSRSLVSANSFIEATCVDGRKIDRSAVTVWLKA